MKMCIELGALHPESSVWARTITWGQEFDMVQEFISYKKRKYESKRNCSLAIFIEPMIHETYPDVVFVEYDPQKFEHWNEKRWQLSTIDRKILYYIFSKRNVTKERIEKNLSLRPALVLESIEKLLDSELIDKENNFWRIRDRENIFGVRCVEAVEAKINGWRNVLQQVIINASFASENSVLLRRKCKMKVETEEEGSSLGLGIYLYDNKNFSEALKPRRRRFPMSESAIYINEMLGYSLYHQSES